MVVPVTVGYGDETLDGTCCFRGPLAEPKFDTRGSKTMVTEILALRVWVSLFKEYFGSSRSHWTPWRIFSGPLTQYFVVLRQLSLCGSCSSVVGDVQCTTRCCSGPVVEKLVIRRK